MSSLGISASGLYEQARLAITHMKSSPSSPSSCSNDSSYFTIGLIHFSLVGLFVTAYFQSRRRGLGARENNHGQENTPMESSNTYDVFINFRGKDTRRGFVSHLHEALGRNNIRAYLDDRDLKRGNKISSSLLEAIEQSKISIVVFSEKYASSRWTMDELVKIMDCKRTRGQIVLPIFYRISPSKVRKKRSFSGVFKKHHNMSRSRMEEVKQLWTKAMAEAADLAGWESSQYRTDSRLLDVIVNQVKEHLKPTSPASEGLPSPNISYDESNSSDSSDGDSTSVHSNDELDFDDSSHDDDPTMLHAHDELDSSGSSHDDPTTPPSCDEPEYGDSSRDDPSTPPNEPNSGSLSHDNPTPSLFEEPCILSHDNLTTHPDEPNSGSLSHEDPTMPSLLEEPNSGVVSYDDSITPPSHNEPNSGDSSHDKPSTPLDEPNSNNLSHDDPTSSPSLDEPTSGNSSYHDPTTTEDYNSLKKCLSHGIPSLLAYLGDRTWDVLWRKKKRERSIPRTKRPHQPSRLDSSTSHGSLYRVRYLPKNKQSWHGSPRGSPRN